MRIREVGLELLFFSASTPAEIDTAFAAIAGVRADALFIAPDGFLASRASQFATLTARDRLPASIFSSEAVAVGLLMSYGTSIADVFRQVGVLYRQHPQRRQAGRASCFAIDQV